MLDFTNQAASLCQRHYSAIKQKLEGGRPGPKTLPSTIWLVFKPQLQDEKGRMCQAITHGATIFLNAWWFMKYPEDIGSVIHELAHVIQNYPPDPYFWLQEGIADYIRFWLGYHSFCNYPACGANDHYTDGYGCAAAFLAYIESHYDREIIPKLNQALRQGQYNDTLFQFWTGHTLEELWQSFRNSQT